jgi:glucose/arabinose dehydrogenase
MRILLFLMVAAAAYCQPQANALGPGPWTYTTYEKNQKIRVSVVTRGLSHPWGLVFLPGGDMLVTERPGRVRIIHTSMQTSVVAPEAIADLSKLSVDVLFDIALHPEFAKNGFVYLTYIKKGKAPDGKNGYWATTALARGKFDGKALTGVEDVFVADAWQPLNGGDGSRVAFGPDGKMYLSSSHRRNPDAPQDLSSDVGNI